MIEKLEWGTETPAALSDAPAKLAATIDELVDAVNAIAQHPALSVPPLSAASDVGQRHAPPSKLESREGLRLSGSGDDRDSAGEKEGLAAAGADAGQRGGDPPYDAVSVNGRAMEWKGPLWDAINDMQRFCGFDRERMPSHVTNIENAVEIAMRLALETSRPAAVVAPVEPASEAVERLRRVLRAQWGPRSPSFEKVFDDSLTSLIAASREAGRREAEAQWALEKSTMEESDHDAMLLLKYRDDALATARAAAEQARADTERLDWLQEHPTDYDRGVPVWELGARESGRTVLEGPSVREAIDAEIHARAPREGGSAE